MRIALVTPGFSADESDWCIPALHDFVRELANQHRVTVFALRYPHTTAPYRFHGADVVPFGAGQRGRVASAPALLACLGALQGRGRAGGFDIVHGLWAGETGGIAVRAARRFGVPSVVSLMGGELADLPDVDYGGWRSRQPGRLGWLRAHARRRSAAASLRRASGVTAGSEFLRELSTRRLDLAPVVLPLGVSEERFSAEPEEGEVRLSGEPAILSVGSLIGVKDHATALEAFVPIQREWSGARLHVVGDGPLREGLEERAQRLGIAEATVFHGEVAHDAMPGLYRGCDLCLLSSRHESQGMVVLEAAACGRVTVGTRVGVLPELVPADWLAEPGDAPALAVALEAAIRDVARREEVALALQEHVRAELTVGRQTKRWTDFYQSLGGGGVGARGSPG